jgi:hypothetical protein
VNSDTPVTPEDGDKLTQEQTAQLQSFGLWLRRVAPTYAKNGYAELRMMITFAERERERDSSG